MVGQDEVTHLGENNVTPATATENAVMACARNFQVFFVVAGDTCAELMCGLRLTGARDIVELSFDGQ
jgi:hypothetical protein